jgi:hypothetical protein
MRSIFSTWWRPAVFLRPPSRLFTDSKKPLRQAKLSALRLAGGRFSSFSLHKEDKTSDPHVFGSPGSGSISQRYVSGSGFGFGSGIRLRIRLLLSSCKNSKKNFDSYYFVSFFYFLSLKNDVYVPVPSKSEKQNLF